MLNGKSVIRTMYASEIIKANTIGHREGEDARIAEYVRLFNEQYSEPQKITHRQLSVSEERYYWLLDTKKIIPLSDDEREELQNLEEELFLL